MAEETTDTAVEEAPAMTKDEALLMIGRDAPDLIPEGESKTLKRGDTTELDDDGKPVVDTIEVPTGKGLDKKAVAERLGPDVAAAL